MLHQDQASQDEVHRYLQRWGLMTPELAAHLIRFLTEPASRSYVICYPAGLDLCRAYVAGQPDRFRRLLTEQVRVGDLLAAQNLDTQEPGVPLGSGTAVPQASHSGRSRSGGTQRGGDRRSPT
jgi:hypothetical protein